MWLRFCLGLATATVERAATAAALADSPRPGPAAGPVPWTRATGVDHGPLHALAAATPLVASAGSATGITLAANAAVQIAYIVDGTAAAPASWTISGSIPPGLNFSGLTSPGVVNVDNTPAGVLILSGSPTAAGTYNLTLEAWEAENAGEVNSPLYSYQIVVLASSAGAPSFTTQPQDQTVTVGQSATFTAAATGSPAYQWQDNGVNIPGANSSTLILPKVDASTAGVYSVIATNSGGPAFSRNATLTVVNAVNAPVFTSQPVPQTVSTGSTAVFRAAATGSPSPAYQWFFNGGLVPGATGTTLVISDAATGNAGLYSCVASNSGGDTSSAQALLSVVTTANPGRLINLSVLNPAGKGQVLTVGFVTGGGGTAGSQNLLIRATGPALAALGLPGTLTDPTLTVLSNSTVVAANDNWGTPPSNQAAVNAADIATGAFPLSVPTSLDAALVTSLASGGYTAQISGNGDGPGTALAEVYDDTPPGTYAPTSPRLINLSALTQIAAGNSLTAGFVVGGTSSKTVLIRATGPALAALGVSGTMPDPQLALHATVNGQDTVLAANAGWGGDPEITAVGNAVLAFPLNDPSSKDSVLLATLAPGAYTAVASSVSGAAGTVLIEVYEVP